MEGQKPKESLCIKAWPWPLLPKLFINFIQQLLKYNTWAEHAAEPCTITLDPENWRTMLLRDFSRVPSLEHHPKHELNLLCQISQPVQVADQGQRLQWKHPPLPSPRTLPMTFHSKAASLPSNTPQHSAFLQVSSEHPHSPISTFFITHWLQFPPVPSNLLVNPALLTTDRNTDSTRGAYWSLKGNCILLTEWLFSKPTY